MVIADEPKDKEQDPKKLPNPSEWLTLDEFLDPTLDPEAPATNRRQLKSESDWTFGEAVMAQFKRVSPADFIGFADTVKEVRDLTTLHDAADDYALGIADEKQHALVMRTFADSRDQPDGLPQVGAVAASVARDMPAFIQEMAVGGGAIAAGRRMVSGAVKKSAAQAVEKEVEKSIGRLLAEGVVRGTGVFTAETGISAMTGGGRLQANLLQRTMRGMGMQEDEAGKLSLVLEATKPDLLAALPAALVDTLIEPIAESSGLALAKLPLLNKLDAFQTAVVKRLMGEGHSVQTVTKMLAERGAWNRFVLEVAEEPYGDLLRTGAGFTVPGAEDLQTSLLYEWEEAAGMVLGIGALSGGAMAVDMAELYVAHRSDRKADDKGIPDWARDAMPKGDGVVGVTPRGTAAPPDLNAEILVHTEKGAQKMRVVGRSVIDRQKDQVERGEGPEHEEILWAVPVEDATTAEDVVAEMLGVDPKKAKARPKDKGDKKVSATPSEPGRPAGAENDPLAGRRSNIPAEPVTEEQRAYFLASFGAANEYAGVSESIPVDPKRTELVDFWADRGVDVIFADVGPDPSTRATNPRHGIVVVSDAVPLEDGPESLPRTLGHEFVHELAKVDMRAFDRLERLVKLHGGEAYLRVNREAAKRDLEAEGVMTPSEQRLREEALAYRAQDLWNTILAMTRDDKVELLRAALEADKSLFSRIKGWVRQLARLFGFRLDEPIMAKMAEAGVDLGEVAPPVAGREGARAKAARAKQAALQAVHLADAMETILAGRAIPARPGKAGMGAGAADPGLAATEPTTPAAEVVDAPGRGQGFQGPGSDSGAPTEESVPAPAPKVKPGGWLGGGTHTAAEDEAIPDDPDLVEDSEGQREDSEGQSEDVPGTETALAGSPGVSPGTNEGQSGDGEGQSGDGEGQRGDGEGQRGDGEGAVSDRARYREALITLLARWQVGKESINSPEELRAVARSIANPVVVEWFEGLTDKGQLAIYNAALERVDGREKAPPADPQVAERKREGVVDYLRASIARMLLRGEDLSTMEKLTALIRHSSKVGDFKVWESLTRKQQEELAEEGVVLVGRQVAEQFKDDPAGGFRAMVSIYRSQPKLSTRTSTSAERQAYSTPLPLAYVASRLGRLEEGARVLEPTAGTGMLLIEVDPRLARVNELDDSRAAALRWQGFQPTQEDATEMPLKEGAFDRVIANPPFGKLRDAAGKLRSWKIHGTKFKTIDHVIALRALDAMAADGRAVLIVGGKQSLGREGQLTPEHYRERDTYAFLSLLHKRFNVVKHAQVSGKLYERQGAAWPVDVIVIDGKNPTGDFRDDLPKPAFEEPPQYLETWDQVGDLLNEADSLDAPEVAGGSGGGASDAPEGGSRDLADVPGPSGGPGGSDDRQAPAGGSERAPTGVRAGGRNGDARGAPGVVAGDPDAGGDGPVRGPGGGVEVAPAGDARLERPGGPEQEQDAEGVPGGVPAPLEREGLTEPRPARRETIADEALEEGAQAKHYPVSSMTSLDTMIPANLVAPTREALDDVKHTVGDIDAFVAERFGLTAAELRAKDWYGAEQVEALAMAMIQIDQGKAFINAAQTGIGKGRTVAGLLQYAHRKGLTPVFVTARPLLYADMVRDLYDTGMLDYLRERYGPDTHLNVYPTDEDSSLKDDDPDTGKKVRVVLPPEPGGGQGPEMRAPKPKVREKIRAHIAQTGKLPEDLHVVMTTYSQIQPVDQQKPWRDRHADLRRLAPNAFFVFDESHKASGDPKSGRDEERYSLAGIARELVQLAHSVAYSSATWAKNMKAFGLYSRTDLGMVADLLANRSGDADDVPFMSMVSRGLVRAKQLLRFEKSFDGIEMTPDRVDLDEDLVREMTQVVDAIFTFDLKIQGEREDAINDLIRSGRGARDGGIGEGTIYANEFFTVMHNLVAQMMVAAKAEHAAQAAIRAVRSGEKVVLAVSKTFGTSLEELASAHGIREGDTFDYSFRRMFELYLKRVMRITLKDAQGGKTYVDIEDRLSPEAQGWANEIRARLEATDFSGLPASPIDYMRARIAEAGVAVEEMTGREAIAEYQAPERYRLASRSKGSAAKSRTVRDFNGGKVDVVIINKSAAEGVSMHSSKGFSDQRPRRMIVVEFEQDVNDVMQIFGRINRTGQVAKPRYTLLTTNVPSEWRPTVGIMRRLASLNANTSAGRKGSFAIDAPDFMNRYGDQVVEELLKEHPEFAGRLFGDKKPDRKDIARKFTNRIAVLDPAIQRSLLEDVDERYQALIEEVNDAGTNTLVVPRRKVLSPPLDAVTKPSPLKGEAFGDDVEIKRYKIEVPRRPLSLEAVKKRTAGFLERYDKEGEAAIAAREGVVRAYMAGEAAAMRALGELSPKTEEEHADRNKRYTRHRANYMGAEAFLDSLTNVRDLVAVMRQKGQALLRVQNKAPGFESEVFVVGFKLSPVVGDGSPAAFSSIKLHVLPVLTGRLHYSPMTQAAPALVGRPAFTSSFQWVGASDATIEEVIAKRNGIPSEWEGYFVTGNPIGGLGLYGDAAQNVVFLDMPDGSKVEALWMPDKWTPGNAAIRSTPLDPADAAAYLMWVATERPGTKATLRTGNGVSLVTNKNGDIELQVVSKGNRAIYTSPGLRAIVGDLTRRGSGPYRAVVPFDSVGRVAELVGREFGQAFSPQEPTLFEHYRNSREGETHAVRRRPRKMLAQLHLPEETRSQFLRRKMVRLFNRLHQYREGLIEVGGIVTDDNDVVLAERLMHGRTRERLRELDAEYVQRIIAAMVRGNITQNEIDQYLYARHAPSRNKVIEERQAAAGNEDPNPAGSGMETARAYEIVAEYEGSERGAEFTEIGQLVDSMMEESLLRSVHYGLITDDQFDQYITQWEHYIPLRTTVESRRRSLFDTGRELGARGPEFKRAMGRGTEADSPLAYAIHQAQRTILRGERNAVGVTLLRMFRENAEHIESLEEDVEDAPTDPDGEPDNLIERKLDLDEHTLHVKVDGKTKRLIIRDKLVVRAMKRFGEAGIPEELRHLQAVMRFYSSLITQLDPDFIIRNAMRDYWQSLLHLSGEHPEVVSEAANPKNWHAAWRGLVWYYRNPAATPTNEWQTYARELAQAGGLPGYFGPQKLEERVNDINKQVERLIEQGKGKEAMRAFFSFMGTESQSVEGAMRLVTYRALRRRGTSAKQAASYAKDLTVNFDQRGELGAAFNLAYLFFNASTQGIYRVLSGMARNKRMQKVAASVIVFGAINGMLQRIIGGDDEDGIPFYDKRSPYEKDTKVIFMLPGTGRAATVPMPYIWNALYRLGDHLAAVVMGAETKGDAIASSWELALSTINPWGQERHIALLISPTIIDPFASTWINEKHHGGPVYPDLTRWERQNTPDSELVWNRNRNDWLHKFARGVSDLTGGDETKGGFIDFSPESARHMLEFLGGGVGKFALRTVTEASNLASGEESVDFGNVPILRTIVGSQEQSWRTEEGLFYKWTDAVLDVDVKLKRASERNRPERMAEIERDYERELALLPDAEAARSRMRALRKDALEEQDTKLRRELHEMIKAEVREFNARAYSAGLR